MYAPIDNLEDSSNRDKTRGESIAGRRGIEIKRKSRINLSDRQATGLNWLGIREWCVSGKYSPSWEIPIVKRHRWFLVSLGFLLGLLDSWVRFLPTPSGNGDGYHWNTAEIFYRISLFHVISFFFVYPAAYTCVFHGWNSQFRLRRLNFRLTMRFVLVVPADILLSWKPGKTR